MRREKEHRKGQNVKNIYIQTNLMFGVSRQISYQPDSWQPPIGQIESSPAKIDLKTILKFGHDGCKETLSHAITNCWIPEKWKYTVSVKFIYDTFYL